MKCWVSVIIFFNLIILLSAPLSAQDATASVTDTAGIKKSSENVEIGEIELMEITIEAEIEKPRVSILPKRMEPELGEMEFIDRSFEAELKKTPEKPFFIKEREVTPVKLNKLKDKLKK